MVNPTLPALKHSAITKFVKNNPFAALSNAGLPAGPPDPVLVTPKKGRVVLRRETAHRGGKSVILVADIPPQIPGAEIERLARQLKKACGCGGTVKGREIEIQGDQPGKVRAVLEAEGFRVAGIA